MAKRTTYFDYLGFPCYWSVCTRYDACNDATVYLVRRDYARGIGFPRPDEKTAKRLVIEVRVKPRWLSFQERAWEAFVQNFNLPHYGKFYERRIKRTLDEMTAERQAKLQCDAHNDMSLMKYGAWKKRKEAKA